MKNSCNVSVIPIFSSPVICMAYNRKYNTVISADSRGTIEYWKGDTFEPPGTDITRFSLKVKCFEWNELTK